MKASHQWYVTWLVHGTAELKSMSQIPEAVNQGGSLESVWCAGNTLGKAA